MVSTRLASIARNTASETIEDAETCDDQRIAPADSASAAFNHSRRKRGYRHDGGGLTRQVQRPVARLSGLARIARPVSQMAEKAERQIDEECACSHAHLPTSRATGSKGYPMARKQPRQIHQLTVSQFEAMFPDEDTCNTNRPNF